MGKYVHRLKDELELGKKLSKNPSTGYLVCKDTLIAREGVLVYNAYEMPDALLEALGHPPVVRVMRDAATLTDNMEKYDGLPLTDGHWYEPVTVKDNSRVGGLLSDQKKTKKGVKACLTFFDTNMIFDIESDEKREVSLGYDSELEIEAGNFNGEAYDVKLTRITPNHVALTRAGRCGPECAIGDSATHDSSGCGCGNCTRKNDSNLTDEGNEDMTIKLKSIAVLDSIVEVNSEGDSESVIRSLVAKLSAAETSVETLQGKLDTTTTELGDTKKKFDDDALAKLIQDGVTERVAVLSKASLFAKDDAGVKELDALTNLEVMKKVLGDAKHDMEGRTDTYIQAAFDTLEPPKKSDGNAQTQNGKKNGQQFADNANNSDDVDPVEAARNKFLADNAKSPNERAAT